MLALLILLAAAFSAGTARAQGVLTNGWTHFGNITTGGTTNTWTFAAALGDRITVRVGEISQTNNFTPRIRLTNPNGVQLDVASGPSVAEVTVVATNSGTLAVMIDGIAANATGTYRLTLAKTPGTIMISPGDEGGPLTNGVMHAGNIDLGDLDVWNFAAVSGEAMIIEIGETLAGSSLTPAVWLYGPDGRQLEFAYGASAALVSFRATNSGTFTVVAGDYSSAYLGSGDYRLTLAKTGAPIVVSPGDEGGPLTNGVMHAGVISVGDMDVWNFSANSGETMMVEMGEAVAGSALTPALWLYGPDGRQLDFAYGAAAAQVSFRATNSGTFTIVAGDYSSGYAGSGDYRLTLARTGAPILVSPGDEGGPLTNGVMHTGVIGVGDMDVWSIQATSGDSMMIGMGETVAGSALTSALWLYGPDGRLLDFNYGAAAAQVGFRATNSGTFTVVASDYSSGYAGSGNYRLTLAKTGAPILVSAGDEGGPLTNAVTHTGTINVGDLDAWSIQASSGETLFLAAGEANGGSGLTPALWFYGPDGRLLDFVYGTAATETSFRATNSGTFTVVVGDYYSSGYSGSGDYRLTVAKTGAPIIVSPGDEGGPMTNGVMHAGTITLGDLDVWSFTAVNGDTMFLGIGETTNSTALSPALWLYGPDGRLLTSGYGAAAAVISFRATNNGTFTVVVGDASSGNTGIGDYRLTLAKTGAPIIVSPGDESGPLTNGVTQTGAINVGDLDVWTFTAVSDEALTIGIGEFDSAGLFTPAIWLYGPDGRLLDSSYGATAAQVSFRATNSGTFTVVAGDYSSAYSGSGNYRLTLAKTGVPIVVSPGDEGGPLTNGVMHTGVINVGDVDVWSFNAVSGEALTIAMGERDKVGVFTPALWFYGPDGRLLDSSYGSVAAQVSFRATNSGTFTVVAGDYSSAYSGSGDYRLTLAKTGSPVEVSPGDEGGRLNGSNIYDGILDAGDLDVWSFTLCAGESIALRLDEQTAGSGLTPWLRLYGRDGTLMRSVSGAATAQFSLLTTNGGTFLVVAGDFSSGYAGSGAYRLTVNGLSDDLRLCDPRISGTNATISGVGGVSGTEFTVLTSPLVEAPLATWTPLFTNQFDFYGTFTRTNPFIRAEPRRFFIIRQAGDPGPN